MAKAEGKLEKDREDNRSKEQVELRGIGIRQPLCAFQLSLSPSSPLSLRPRGGSATATSGGAVAPSPRPFSAVGHGLGPRAPSRCGAPMHARSCSLCLGPATRWDAAGLLVGLRRVRITEVRIWPNCNWLLLHSHQRSDRIRRFFRPGPPAPHRTSRRREERRAHRFPCRSSPILRRAVDLTDPSGGLPSGGRRERIARGAE